MTNWFTQSPQFKRGMNVEKFLDNLFKQRGFKIKMTTPTQERKQCLGDRIFTKKGHSTFIEYKSGLQTFYTGNIFLETVSVDTANKPGWIYTSQADYIHYACLLNNKILVFRPDDLRSQIEQLKRMFREVKTSNNQNNGYDTWGVIVPLDYAEQFLAIQVIDL